MNWYLIVKSFHVMSAIIWVGGAFSIFMLGTRASLAHDDEALVGIMRQTAWAGDYIFRPAGMATLAFGLTAASIGELWGELFVVLGLIGIVSSIAFAIVFLSPGLKKVDAMFNQSGLTPAVVSEARRVSTLARFDLTLLFCIVANMVLKPTPSNWVVLVILASALIAAAVLWLVPGYRAGRATA